MLSKQHVFSTSPLKIKIRLISAIELFNWCTASERPMTSVAYRRGIQRNRNRTQDVSFKRRPLPRSRPTKYLQSCVSGEPTSFRIFFPNFHFSKFFLFHPIQFSIFQISIFTQVSIFGLSWDFSEISATEQILLRFGIIFVDRLSAVAVVVVVVVVVAAAVVVVVVVVVAAAAVVVDLFVRQSKVLLPDWGLDNAMNLARADFPRETRAHEIRNQWKTLTNKSNKLVVSLPEIKRTFYYEQVCFLKAEK